MTPNNVISLFFSFFLFFFFFGGSDRTIQPVHAVQKVRMEEEECPGRGLPAVLKLLLPEQNLSRNRSFCHLPLFCQISQQPISLMQTILTCSDSHRCHLECESRLEAWSRERAQYEASVICVYE